MSKLLDSILSSLEDEVEEWAPVKSKYGKYFGVEKGEIEIVDYGNGVWTSIIELLLRGARIQLLEKEKRKLERAVVNWYQNAPLKLFTPEANSAKMASDLKEAIENGLPPSDATILPTGNCQDDTKGTSL